MGKIPKEKPELPDDSDKDPVLNVRVVQAQKKAYWAAANKKRKKLSEWIRETLDAAAESQGIKIE